MNEEYKKHKWDILFLITVSVVGFYFTSNFSILSVSGNSMYPTFEDGDVIFIKKEKTKEVGQIAIFNPPSSWNKESRDIKYVKRIVGKPGDKITIYNGDLFVNEELFAPEAATYCPENKEFQVPVGQYFLVGDNYGKSNDSLMNLCEGNNEYLVQENSIIVNGNESFRTGD